jgi:hypothetical protein
LRRRFASVSAIAVSQTLVQRQFPPLHGGCSTSREFGGAVDVAAIFGVVFPAHLIDYFTLGGMILFGAEIAVLAVLWERRLS